MFDPQSYRMYVFNRWGKIVFESNNPNVGWNGRLKDIKNCQDGVYTWVIKYELLNEQETKSVNGHINLIR